MLFDIQDRQFLTILVRIASVSIILQSIIAILQYVINETNKRYLDQVRSIHLCINRFLYIFYSILFFNILINYFTSNYFTQISTELSFLGPLNSLNSSCVIVGLIGIKIAHIWFIRFIEKLEKTGKNLFFKLMFIVYNPCFNLLIGLVIFHLKYALKDSFLDVFLTSILIILRIFGTNIYNIISNSLNK